jgi:hypothetical protein
VLGNDTRIIIKKTVMSSTVQNAEENKFAICFVLV